MSWPLLHPLCPRVTVTWLPSVVEVVVCFSIYRSEPRERCEEIAKTRRLGDPDLVRGAAYRVVLFAFIRSSLPPWRKFAPREGVSLYFVENINSHGFAIPVEYADRHWERGAYNNRRVEPNGAQQWIIECAVFRGKGFNFFRFYRKRNIVTCARNMENRVQRAAPFPIFNLSRNYYWSRKLKSRGAKCSISGHE